MKHAIVIGTGAGGLAAAGYLAKRGFDVLALEQGERLGGYLCPFVRGGFSFDVGVHYLGQCRRKGQVLYDVLDGLGIAPESLFTELDPNGFDVYRFGDFEIRMCRGLEDYRDRLVHAFPSDEKGLRHLFDLVHRLLDLEAMLEGGHRLAVADLVAIAKLPPLARWLRKTLGELLDATLTDPRARAVVAAAGGDYGLPPSRASAITGLDLIGHYSDGGFYPRGGSGALRDALVSAAESNGARFRTRSCVERILTHDHEAIGVQLTSGERLEADVIVSDSDPVATYTHLLAPDYLPRKLARHVREATPSLATFGLYLGMKRDLMGRLGRRDVWDYPSWDIEETYAPVFRGELPAKPAFFLSPSSLKDDTGALAPPGCTALEIVTFVPYAMFQRWRGLRPGERGQSYRDEKERVARWLQDAVEERWPGLVGDVVVRETSTPITNEAYTMAIEGGAYGPAQTPNFYGPWRFGTRTPIRNLLLAGAGVLGGGVTPSLVSGRLAAERAAA